MTTHELATLMDHLRLGFGDNLVKKTRDGLSDASSAFRELPDLRLNELSKQLRKSSTTQPKAESQVDVTALIDQIREIRNSEPASTATSIEIEGLGLNNAQLKAILQAFNVSPTRSTAGNLSKVQQLLTAGSADAGSSHTAVTEVDKEAVAEGVALYQQLLNDRTLSIIDVRVKFEPFTKYSKPVIEEITRQLGYTASGSKPAITKQMLEDLEGIKLSQHRADRIRTGT